MPVRYDATPMNTSSRTCALALFCVIAVPAWAGNVTRNPFGTLPSGEKVEVFTLANASGMEVRVINLGGIVTSIRVPDRQGRFKDVVLGFDALADYAKNPPYFSALVGRYANRVGKARFALPDAVALLDGLGIDVE